MRYEDLGLEELEALRNQITDYFETYYSELRSRLSDHSLNLSSVPEHFRGQREIITELGNDGAVITHWPAGQDSFDFHIAPESSAKELAAEQCGGTEILDYQPGEDFGFYEIPEPLKLEMNGEVVWTSEWTRMQISSRFEVWSDPDDARRAVEEDLQPYMNAGGF